MSSLAVNLLSLFLAATLSQAILAAPASSAPPTGRAVVKWLEAYLDTTLADRASGRIRGDALAGREYLADLIAGDEALARCLPTRMSFEAAALLAIAYPREGIDRFRDGDQLVRAAVAPGGQCVIASSNFLGPAMAWGGSTKGARHRDSIRGVVAALMREYAQAEPRLAACVAQPAHDANLALAVGAHLATLPDSPDSTDLQTGAILKAALQRLCAPAVPGTEQFRDEADRQKPPATECTKGIPALVSKTSPKFPRRALRADIDAGSVLVHLRIDGEGRPVAIRVVRVEPPVLHGVFDAALKSALWEWKWAAGRCPFVAEIPVDFRLSD
jgi:hypothetical protein